MSYLALGVAALAFFYWLSKRRTFQRRELRLLTAAFALVAFTGAAYAGVRGSWAPAIVLLVIGLWLAGSSRKAPAAPAVPPTRMAADEARRILGVGPDATPEEVRAAHTRLIRMNHPDTGGTVGLAAQLNAARDRLLGK
jgi:hypothetical protein